MSSVNAPSSSTLWATGKLGVITPLVICTYKSDMPPASKEWVIQPKPKPGRKPKKDPPILPQDDAEVIFFSVETPAIS